MPQGQLVIKGIQKTYGQTMALAPIDVSLRTDQVTALAGGNGSGKSTLLKIIAGVIGSDCGSVEWNDRRLPLSVHLNRSLGIEMVFQDGALCPDCSVLENLFLGRERLARLGFLARKRMLGLARTLIARYRFHLPDLEIETRTLSGGQQKAVAIGRALLSEPRLLLLDEPTAALGVTERNVVLNVIRELRANGVGVILCTHSPEEISATAERLLVLRHGKLIHDGSVAALDRVGLAELMSS